MFPQVSTRVSFPRLEEKILDFWTAHEVFARSIAQRTGRPEYVFYDGPPFATGLPHYGHLLAGTIKDVIPRYQTMRGKLVERRFGWDCHGLPVEYEMEQALKISGKREIERYGIDRFNEACRGIVLRYTAQWEEIVARMGRWVDFKNHYRTMDPDYMESLWWVFKTIWDKGLLYEGTKSMPYCPRCATPLSNFEVQQNYIEVEDPALTVRFRSRTREHAYYLAWTTTPWTLPSNVALAVGAEIPYVLVGDKEDGRRYILAEARVGLYWRSSEKYAILDRFPGAALAGEAYEPLFPYFAAKEAEGAFRIHTADFVATDEGTGIVHIAPGFGEEDHDLAGRKGIPVVCPVDAEGCFTSEVPDWQGVFVKEADDAIVLRLKAEKKLVRREKYAHNYPHCWRCESPLIFRAISTWFVRIEPIKEAMLAANRAINWVPAHIKEGRFGKWLAGARDWAVSRNRYWGTPLPIWKCACGEAVCVGSRAELEELSRTRLDDLHKHFADKVTIPCGACKGVMARVPEVLDCWFESGSMPYAQSHYPFEHKARFEASFPADFIGEGLDQTRGWFYTLVVLGTALFGKAPFKNVVVNGLVLAENGQKMSKRLKNYPEPREVIDKYGADALRLYLLDSPLVRAEDLRFSEKGVQDKLRTILLPLWNALCFFAGYANIDAWTPDQTEEPEELLDRWIMSSLQRLKRRAAAAMDAYDLQGAIEPLVAFIEDLTNWYIRRSRRRFWKPGGDAGKRAAYTTLYRVLKELARAIAPFVPFIAEEIHRALRRDDAPESVHLCEYPLPDPRHEDEALDALMGRAIEAAGMARALRVKHKLKIRQPLAALILVTRDRAEREGLAQLADLLRDELNVKEIRLAENEDDLVDIAAKPDFKALGPRLGPKVKQAAPRIAKLDRAALRHLEAGGSVELSIGGEAVPIAFSDIVLTRTEKEGLIVENSGTLTVGLDTHLTPELIAEGLAREFVNKVQNMRKDAEFEITDRIEVRFKADAEVAAALAAYKDYVAGEVLADAIEPCASAPAGAETWDLNGREAAIAIARRDKNPA